MMKLAVSAVFMLALASATGLHAQATAEAPSPEKLQLAQQIVEANGGQERATATVKLIMTTMSQGLQRSMPAAQQRLMSQIQADLQSEVVEMIPAIVAISEQAYAQTLTEQELRDQLAWMQSDSGRSIQKKTPVLMQQIVQAEMPMVQAMMPKMVEHVLQRVCTEVQCSAKDREVVAAAMKKAMAAHTG